MALVLALAGSARAEIAFAGAAGASLEEAVLVGTRGEVFRRDGGTWRRLAGGVAAEVAHVWGSALGDLWVVGPRAPAYRHDGAAWHTVPGARGGPAVLATPGSPQPALAVGRRIFLGDRRGVRPVATAPAAVTSLFARSSADMLAVADGRLLQLARGWRQLLVPDGEPIVRLCGGGVALGARGGVFSIAAGRARRVPVDALVPRACGASAGRTIVAGDGGALVEITPRGPARLPALALAADDAIAAVLPLRSDGVLCATRTGRVFVRDGDAFREETLDPALPLRDDLALPAVTPAIVPVAR